MTNEGSYQMHRLQVIIKIPDELLDSCKPELIGMFLADDVLNSVLASLQILWKRCKESGLSPKEQLSQDRRQNIELDEQPIYVNRTGLVLVGIDSRDIGV